MLRPALGFLIGTLGVSSFAGSRRAEEPRASVWGAVAAAWALFFGDGPFFWRVAWPSKATRSRLRVRDEYLPAKIPTPRRAWTSWLTCRERRLGLVPYPNRASPDVGFSC